jgi:glyoxylase-like metal-dependent hydrolase (beta-lactamase superfamily II)
MAAYMASLDRLKRDSWRRLLPGHGDPITTPSSRLDELIAHRRSREAQILAALTGQSADAATLTARIYTDIPRHLLPAAERNVLAHLIDLASRSLVSATPALHPEAVFSLN